MRVIFLIAVCTCCVQSMRADERFWLDAAINGQRARLQFDSGADRLFLHRPAAERLGFKLPPAKSPERPYYWAREKCILRFGDFSEKTRFAILEYPSHVRPDDGEDGLLGWHHLKDRIIALDAVQQKLEFLREVPGEALGWTKLSLASKWPTLALEVPNPDRSKGIIMVDTGSETGVGFSPRKWNDWRAAHPNQPTTCTAGYNVKAGMMVREQTWVDELPVGPLVLTGVVLEEADSLTAGAAGTKHVATLGMAALKRLDFIVDSKQRVAYLRPKNAPPGPYQHNRLGAVFVPRDARSDDLVFHVMNGSPASEAGIRNGDVLLRINQTDVSRSHPNPDNGPTLYSPAGSQLELTLKRGGERFNVTVVLRDILAPEATSPPPSSK